MPGPSRALLTSLLVCLLVARGAAAQYRLDPFTTSNGFQQSIVSAVPQTRDGHLSTAKAVLSFHPGATRVLDGQAIDPVQASHERPPLVVSIESVLVDGAAVAADGTVHVEPGPRDIEINYRTPAFFDAEHIRFRYRLEGLNGGWVDAGTRRTLHYSYLPPGNYTFRIQAAGTEGQWSEGATVLRLSVRPAFYQTPWFSVSVMAALVLLGAGISTLRVRRLQEAERRLTILLGEATAELAGANRRLEQLATIDELTQLANRRRFSEVLEQEWQRAIREGASLGLLMMDVDSFKPYNDTYGHQAGDAALQRVGAVLLSRVRRPSDLAARYGGEEFAVVLPGTDEAGALTVGEWIRAEVERQRMPHGASRASDVVTVSVGAAVVTPTAGMPVASLVAAADAALYRAKESGRNMVIAGTMEASPDAGAAATSLSRMRIHHPGS